MKQACEVLEGDTVRDASGPRCCPGRLGAPVSESEGAQPCAPPGRKLGRGLEVTLWNRLGQLSTLGGKIGVSVDEKNDLFSPLLWVAWGEGRKKMAPANGSEHGCGHRAPSHTPIGEADKNCLWGAGACKACPALEERESGRDGRGPSRGETDFLYTRTTCPR